MNALTDKLLEIVLPLYNDWLETVKMSEGFRSLDDSELLELFENKDFNAWLKEGAKL